MSLRLLLDAHVSGRRIARPLRGVSHDVRAVDEEKAIEGLSDPDLFDLALSEHRILVTRNVKDFVPLLVQCNLRGQQHSGCILIPRTIAHEHFGLLFRGIREAIDAYPRQEDWFDRVRWLSRG